MGYVAAAMAIVGAVMGQIQANKQAAQQRNALRSQQQEAQTNRELQQQDMRRQNSKDADISAILQANQNAALSSGSTMLTPTGGAAPSPGSLGSGNKLG